MASKKLHKNWQLFLLVFVALVVIFARVMADLPALLFWFCNFVPLVLVVAFIWGDEQIIKGLINIGFFPQLLGTIFLLTAIFFRYDPFDFVASLSYNFLYPLSLLLVHLVPINLALFETYKIKPKVSSLVYSFITLLFLFFLTLFFTAPEYNINFIYGFNPLGIGMYNLWVTLFWPTITFIVLVIPTYMLQLWLYNWNRKRI